MWQQNQTNASETTTVNSSLVFILFDHTADFFSGNIRYRLGFYSSRSMKSRSLDTGIVSPLIAAAQP